MQHHPCCFITPQTKLALQEQSRDAALVSGYQVGRPEPDGERRFRIVEDRPTCQPNLVPTTRTLPASAFHQFIGTPPSAARTHKAIWPPAGGEIFLASFLGGELRLKLTQSLWKRRSRHAPTLPLVACCNNRISRSRLIRSQPFTRWVTVPKRNASSS